MFCATASAKGKSWEKRPEREACEVKGVEPFVVEVAASRGVADLPAYFAPRFAGTLPGPDALRDMPEAVARFCAAVEAGEAIALIGDYDVDGATSTALVLRLLRSLGHAAVEWRIPGRLVDGYGPNERLARELCGPGKASLLVVLDSGTAAAEPLAIAKGLGADVVVIDHHEPGATLPDALLVNPKRRDEDGGLAHLCTVGLAFVFAVGVVGTLRKSGWFGRTGRAEPDLRLLLGLVALGTIADVVPLVGLNRAYVALGLRRIEENAGLRALMRATAQHKVNPNLCGFVLGPCLNAAGRIADMDDSVELLLTLDEARAAELADKLAALNKERRGIQNAAVEAALKAVVATGQHLVPGAIVLRDEGWHPGVVGLVASKLREAFDRPAAIIGGGGKGSARSVEGFDVGSAVIAAAEAGILEKGGGHHAAAGFTCAPGRTEDFKAHLDKALAGHVHPPVPVDVVAAPGEARPEHVQALQAMEPFGMGNPKPRVAMTGGFVNRVEILKEVHIKVHLQGEDGSVTKAMAFSAVGTPLGKALVASEGRYADMLGTLDVDEYRGRSSVVLKIEDVMVGPEIGARADAA